MHVNKQQQEAIDSFKALEILIDFEPSPQESARFTEKGIWLWDCGDLHHYADKKGFWETHVPSNLIHACRLNGGAILAAIEDDVSRRSLYLEQAVGTIILKGVQDLVIEAHFPCGVAGLVGVNPVEQLELLARTQRWLAEQIIRVSHDEDLLRRLLSRIRYSEHISEEVWKKARQADFSNINVFPLVHTCRKNGETTKRSTYFLKRKNLQTHRLSMQAKMESLGMPGKRLSEFEQLSLAV